MSTPNQPCVDMRKNEDGSFKHHPEVTEFYDETRPDVVLLETRCAECALILDSQIVDKAELEVETE